MARTAFLVLSLFGLAACDPFTGTLVVANTATLIHGDKTIPDYILSSQSRLNCSLLHAARNEEYCQEEPPSDTEALADLSSNHYCYRTLGRIDCYDRPDFLASGQTRVNFAAGGYLPRRNDPVPLELRDPEGLAMAGLPAPVPAADAESAAAKPVAAPAAPVTEDAKAPAKKAKTPANKAAKMAPKEPPKNAGPAAGVKAAKPAPKAATQVSLNPPPPAAIPTKGAELAQVPLMRAPDVKVAPLADLPGQGTY